MSFSSYIDEQARTYYRISTNIQSAIHISRQRLYERMHELPWPIRRLCCMLTCEHSKLSHRRWDEASLRYNANGNLRIHLCIEVYLNAGTHNLST